MPKVSVLMPVYNGEQFLREAIESILKQTFGDFEFLIIDDGSTDNSADIVQSYNDRRIRLLSNEQNAGITESLNRGIMEAKGEFICRMDADDVSLPERLETQLNYLEENRDVVMTGTWTIRIDEQGHRQEVEQYPVRHQEILRTIFVHNPFAHGTMMLRRNIVQQVGTYDARFLHNEDYDLWLRIAARYTTANIPEPLVLRRVHTKNITVEKELELVRYRILTLRNAIRQYYRKPHYYVHLVRPSLAYFYRKLRALTA